MAMGAAETRTAAARRAEIFMWYLQGYGTQIVIEEDPVVINIVY
jgi:hypothetical protein